MISAKYRNIHPSYLGKIDINVSSNSDVGMSGSFTPFLPLFDRFYFNPNPEPCDAGFRLEKAKEEYYSTHQDVSCKVLPLEFHFETLDDYVKFIEKYDENFDGLKYEKIEIVEKEPEGFEPFSTDEMIASTVSADNTMDLNEEKEGEDNGKEEA